MTFQPQPARQAKTGLLAAAMPAKRPFAFFNANDIGRATQLANEFDEIAGLNADEAHLRKVMDRFHEVARTDVSLAQWALRFFIARRPGADVLPMPTLRQQLAQHMKLAPHLFAKTMLQSPQPSSPEDAMRYFRHDIDLSDHHLHWHILYSNNGPKNPALQGQLFLYMHEQCLARYDTERIMLGLPVVEPLLKWDDPGNTNPYDRADLPVDRLAPWIHAGVTVGQYSDFDDHGQSPRQLAGDAVRNTLQLLNAVLQRILGNDGRSYADYNALGADLEGNTTSALYPGPHNEGHMALAGPKNGHYNVMSDTNVAMTTPIFYRWHRAIDDYAFAWQEKQPVFTSDFRIPTVRIRRSLNGKASTVSPDIIITLRAAIADIDGPGFDLGAWGERNFGGASFDTVAGAAFNRNALRTTMVQDDLMGEQRLQLEDHWVYFIRLKNDANTDTSVTVRIWLAHHAMLASRRHWIEMDKFVIAVPANANIVAARPSWHSSVIRAKSVDDSMKLASEDDEYIDDANDPKFDGTIQQRMWCECGLPYRLLLPRGTSAGAPFRFMVMLTDAAEDGLESQLHDKECGSVSFCGKNDWEWPDKKAMGFPFHRRFNSQASDPVFSQLDPLPNVSWRDISIINS